MSAARKSSPKTFIQSGNVVFTSIATDSKALIRKIEGGIRKTFGFEVTVVLKYLPELIKIVKAQPFKVQEGERVYITYLESSLKLVALAEAG